MSLGTDAFVSVRYTRGTGPSMGIVFMVDMGLLSEITVAVDSNIYECPFPDTLVNLVADQLFKILNTRFKNKDITTSTHEASVAGSR